MKIKSLTIPAAAMISLGVVLLDQLTKWMVISHFTSPPPDSFGGYDPHVITLIPNYLQVVYRVNTGAAFSSFQEHTLVLAIFSSCVAAVIAVWAWRLKPEELILRGPLALILGGAIGNLIDRFRLGHVTDFIDAHWQHRAHFPTFNVADSGICVGMGLLILLSFLAPRPAESPSADVSGNNPA